MNSGKTTDRFSFFCAGSPEDIVAIDNGKEINRAQFAARAVDLASKLPEKSYIVNHCQNRYHFMLGLAAALLKKQISLFPPGKIPQVIKRLISQYPDVYCLSDQDETLAGMDSLKIPEQMDIEGNEKNIAELVFPADQIVAVAFTSGSTGEPKPYIKVWGGYVREAIGAGKALGLDAKKGGYLVATVPPQHMYGFVASIMLPLQHRYVINADQPFFPEDIKHAIAARAETALFVTTPIHLRACVMEQTKIDGLEMILSSTAPLDASLSDNAEALFSTQVQEFYGSTETGAIASRRQADNDVWKTFEDVTVGLTDEGFAVYADYFYQSPMLLPDNVEVHNESEFVLFGRNTDLIKIAGKRALLSDLNHHLLAIDGIKDGTFFMPDAENHGDSGHRETRLAAFVVAPGLSKNALLDQLRTNIDPVFLPRPLKFVDALPRNKTGKLPRGKLLELLGQETITS